MDNGLLVRMLHALAHLNEQLQPLPHRELVPVAIFGDRESDDVLHYEVRPPLACGPGIEDLGDGRMVHQGQRLTLGFETRYHLTRVHADLYQLDGHAATYRLPLLGQPDLTHAAFADQLEKVIRTNINAGGQVGRRDAASSKIALAVLSVPGHTECAPWRCNTTAAAGQGRGEHADSATLYSRGWRRGRQSLARRTEIAPVEWAIRK